EARALFNAMIDKRPALIARCTSAQDVARVIAYAQEHHLPLAVRGGGHNGAGLGSVDGGVVVDLRPLNAVTVDEGSRTVGIGGGGGNFGVVTQFVFRAHPVTDIVGGPTFWPIENTPELLAAYREFLPELPRHATGFFNFHTIPPGPPFPEEIHLRKACGIVWCIDAPDDEAERLMAPMLELAEPLLHGVQRMPLPELNSAFAGRYGPG